MRYITLDIDPADADADGIADDLATGTAWDSDDAEWLATSAGDGLAHQLVVTTAGNEPGGNGPTLTLTGTDADDNAITEDVVLPNATTIETTKYFKTVTSAAADAATVGTMDIGWVDEVASKTIDFSDWHGVAPSVQLDVTGTISLTFQVSNVVGNQDAKTWFASDNLATSTADDVDELSPFPVRFGRVIVNSYTNTAEAQVYLFQLY